MTRSNSDVGARAAVIAVGLGVLGDALLRATPWGLNLGLWVFLLLAGALILAGPRKALEPPLLMTAAAMLFFAGGFAWRDSPVLRGLDALGLGVSAGLLIWQMGGGKPGRSGLMECLGGVAQATGHTAIGLPHLLARDVEWSGASRVRVLRETPAVLVGLSLAVPLVMLFGGLFLAADAAYRQIVGNFVKLDLAVWLSHAATFGVITWTSGGYLRAVGLGNPAPPILPRQRRFAGLGQVELCTVVAALNLLFFTFVMVQIRYLFGGAALVENTLGLTYAEYARAGFFQLVTVACLVLPLLLLLDWLRHPDASPVPFRFLALGMIGLLSIIMASALFRMRLYQLEFGLTELRFHASVFMLWLAVVLAWFALTVLRGRGNRFIGGALATALVAVIGLHAVNPDARIVQANARYAAQSERPFDAAYAASLSADALPTLLSVLPGLPAETQAELRNQLAQQWNPPTRPAWRSWNWSRARGAEILARAGIE